ncbi:MAG: hypothetical protein A3F43_05285 [Gammaproteobacteria bacterium RIFCSPHIGHO2_12_FULL_42_10]|nr:MAG: hypothetical protein A3F43_05285 [Gammaproteobacteria bacterium RIFCSPHIGHO2_12_FULL_42_10]
MTCSLFSGILRAMQQVISVSKYILFIVLSCLFLLAGDFVYTTVTGVSILDTVIDDTSDSTVWGSMRREFMLDHQVDSARVRIEIRKWLADPDRLNHILKAAIPYIDFIHQETQEKGLPAELALIPVIESEFNPNDHSNKGAVGLWQLMPQTARELGVKTRSGHDERRNVTASTLAALTYFQDLGQMFHGNWLLAIAAYNCGQAKVAHALTRAGTDDFWMLHLPLETRLYVPRLLAIAEIVKNPAKYGVQLPAVSHAERK